MSTGNGNGTKLVWWMMAIFSGLITLGASFAGLQLVELKAKVSVLEAKVDIILNERMERRR